MIGATAAIANKIVFQATPRDAEELAVEFADKPPTEMRREPEMVISLEPVADLLRRGHANPQIQAFVIKLLRPWQDNLKKLKDTIEGERLLRTAYLDEATIYKDEAALYQIDTRITGTTLYRYESDYAYMRGSLGEGKAALEREYAD